MALAPSAAARCVARAAAVLPARRLATPWPSSPSANFNLLVLASRPLSSVAPPPPPSHRRIGAVLPPAPALSPSPSLTSRLSRLSLERRQPRRGLSARAAFERPPGEPATRLTLSDLRDNPGAVKKGRRVGRGIGSSKGKTCGRGHKGQKSRAGRGVHPTFEGGQTKFYKRLPKIGKMKNSKFKLRLISVNVGTVQNYVTMGRLVAERKDGTITMRDMVRAGMFPASAIKDGIKLLGDRKEDVRDKLHIEVPWASATAIDAIENRGGFVTTVHYNRLALRALLKPHKFPPKPAAMLEMERGDEGEEGEGVQMAVGDLHLLPRRARPPPKYMPYYNDYAKRGYLNPKVQLERKRRGMKDIH